MSTLSEYNNNPGNLKPPKGVTYEGQIGVDDNGFAVFESPEYGRSALVNDIKHKLDRGINTPESFVDVYAPAGKENPEDARDMYKIHLSHALGLNGSDEKFPEGSAEKIADVITQREGVSADSKPSAPEPEPVPPSPVVPTTGTVSGPSETAGRAIAGGTTGLLTSGAVETAKQVLPLVPNLWNKFTNQPMNPNARLTRGGLQNYLNGMLDPNVRLPLKDLERLTGKKVQTMAEVQSALRDIQEIKAQRVLKDIAPDPRTGVKPRIYETTPGRPGIDLSEFVRKPAGPIRGAVTRELTTAGDVLKAVAPSVGRVGLGVLGGANAAIQGYDAWEMAKKLKEKKDPTWVDWARLGSKTAATAGGGLSMIPAGITQVVGGALQAPEMAWELYDYATEHPELMKQYSPQEIEAGRKAHPEIREQAVRDLLTQGSTGNLP